MHMGGDIAIGTEKTQWLKIECLSKASFEAHLDKAQLREGVLAVGILKIY